MTVTPLFSAGTVGSDETICSGGSPAIKSYTGGSGGGTLGYQWYSKAGNSNPSSGGTLITGATSSTYTPPTGLTATTSYNVYVTPTCGTAARNNSGR